MKTTFTFLGLLFALTASAQFRRESDKKIYPYTATLQSNDVFIIGRPAVTNFNLAKSNTLSAIGGVNSNNAILISSNQAFLGTNGWTATSTNIAAYQAFLATNNFSPTVTQIVTYVFTTTGIVSNQFTTNQLFAALATSGGTNYNIIIGSPYRSIVATNDVSFTNVSGLGCASVDISPNGADRLIYFPTNWTWLSTNDGTYNFTLSGSQWRTGVTNGASRAGWLSIVSFGNNATNVRAMWRATP